MLGNRLKELREELDRTQTQVAQDLNMSQGSYGLYERDQRSPDYDTLKKIANYYNVSMAYLLGETDKRTPLNNSHQNLQMQPQTIIFSPQNFEYLDEEEKAKVEEYIDFLITKNKKK